MTFWSNPEAVSPHRQRNFSIQAGSDSQMYWVKSVTKPSYDIEVNEYQIGNQRHKYPGLLTWNDITITIYDIGDKVKELLTQLGAMGFIGAKDYGGVDGIGKQMGLGDPFIIQQFGVDIEAAKAVEKWTLANAFIKSVNFGQLAYESDEFIEIEIIVSYDWAEIEGVDYAPKAIGSAPARPAGGRRVINNKPGTVPKNQNKAKPVDPNATRNQNQNPNG